MRLRIIGPWEGVASGLCGTCTDALNSVDTQGHSETRCLAAAGPSRIVSRPLARCSRYREINAMDKWDAEQIGWVLEIKKGQVSGFAPPQKGKN